MNVKEILALKDNIKKMQDENIKMKKLLQELYDDAFDTTEASDYWREQIKPFLRGDKWKLT